MRRFHIEEAPRVRDPPPLTEQQRAAAVMFEILVASTSERDALAPVDRALIERAATRVQAPLHLSVAASASLLDSVREEVAEDYLRAEKRAVLKYLSSNPLERERLGFRELPPAPPARS
jgi:hypothetical protein